MRYEEFLQPAEEYKAGDIIIYSEQIQQRIHELAESVVNVFAGKQVLIVSLLKGSVLLTADLMRALHKVGLTSLTLEIVQVKSYELGTFATSEPQIISGNNIEVKDRIVLVLDDIIDSGKSLRCVTQYLQEKNPASIHSLVLLDKPDRRVVDFTPDFVGFTIPDIWVQGYGMDTDELGRGDSNIIKGPFTYS